MNPLACESAFTGPVGASVCTLCTQLYAEGRLAAATKTQGGWHAQPWIAFAPAWLTVLAGQL